MTALDTLSDSLRWAFWFYQASLVMCFLSIIYIAVVASKK